MLLEDFLASFFLQSPTKVLALLPTFPTSVREIYQFVPFTQFNVGYRKELVIARLSHCRIHYSSDVSPNTLSTHFRAI